MRKRRWAIDRPELEVVWDGGELLPPRESKRSPAYGLPAKPEHTGTGSRHLPPNTVARIQQLIAQGVDMQTIARQTGTAYGTVWGRVRRPGRKYRPTTGA